MQEGIDLDYQNGSSIYWGIANKQTNKIMGTLGYYRGFDKEIGELGWVLKPEFQGQGFDRSLCSCYLGLIPVLA